MNGKGDKPRNCFSKQFKDNYESINWKRKFWWAVVKNARTETQHYTIELDESSAGQMHEENSRGMTGMNLYRFYTEEEAETFLKAYVKGKTSYAGSVSFIGLQERRS